MPEYLGGHMGLSPGDAMEDEQNGDVEKEAESDCEGEFADLSGVGVHGDGTDCPKAAFSKGSCHDTES